ncbi:MAG: energy-coupling factor transporter transmembrane protein EcfT [Firmicutes bacterium]|nr:energy-coupling factor transporter transmembrane protein EcfT [Bacillota bacterium]
MKNIIIGQYVPGEGFFYKLDPRTKIIAIVVLMVAIFMLETITQLLITLGFALLILIVGKLSIIRIIRGLRPIFVLLIFTFIFQIAFNKDGIILLNKTLSFSVSSVIGIVLLTVLWRFLASFKRMKIILFFLYILGIYFIMVYFNYFQTFTSFQLIIYEKGVEMSIFVVIRLLIVITLSTVLTLTTKPTDLTQGLEKLMRPLKVIGLNSEDFALIISISLRYIPTILDEANKIMLAQASRGSDISEGKLKDKIKQVVSLLVPMFIIAFKRSEELADAMESRNFIPGKSRTRINELSFRLLDFITVFLSIACLGASILVKVLL